MDCFVGAVGMTLSIGRKQLLNLCHNNWFENQVTEFHFNKKPKIIFMITIYKIVKRLHIKY
jgi:hypothetical protein